MNQLENLEDIAHDVRDLIRTNHRAVYSPQQIRDELMYQRTTRQAMDLGRSMLNHSIKTDNFFKCMRQGPDKTPQERKEECLARFKSAITDYLEDKHDSDEWHKPVKIDHYTGDCFKRLVDMVEIDLEGIQ